MFPLFVCFVVLIAKALLVAYSLVQIQKAYIDYKVVEYSPDAEFYGYKTMVGSSGDSLSCRN
jgi:hypothetical protein